MKESTRWTARLSVGVVGSILILLFGSAGSADPGPPPVSTYSEAHRIDHFLSLRELSVRPEPPSPQKVRLVSTRDVTAAVVTTTTTTLPPPPDLLYQRYDYYERSQRVTALQMELGMKFVDGTYGPKTRKAHIEALGGPAVAVLIFHPEVWDSPTPCSHGCLPGDGHYELPTLGELVNKYFKPADRELALKIALCESSGRSWDVGSSAVSHAFAIGWFQHLVKYWPERSERAGWGDYHPFHGEANVAVAAWLFYSSGVHHWNPSRTCWEG